MINQGQHLINRMLGKKGPGNQAQNGANLAKPLFEIPNFETFSFFRPFEPENIKLYMMDNQNT